MGQFKVEPHRFYKSKKTEKLYFTLAVGIVNGDKENIVIFSDGSTGVDYIRNEKEFEEKFELWEDK